MARPVLPVGPLAAVWHYILNPRLGSWVGAVFFSFWIWQRFYFGYQPTLLWWLVTFQFVLFVIAYLIRLRPQQPAQGFMEVVFPFICAAMPFALDNLPFKPRAETIIGLIGPAMALMLAGTTFIIAGVFYLRRSFSIMAEVRQPVYLGIYRLSRHPMYLGSMVAGLGLLLYYFHLLNCFIFIIFCLCQIIRAGIEERKIISACPEYRDYAAKVGWFWVIGRRR